jgi:hypothetical protein
MYSNVFHPWSLRTIWTQNFHIKKKNKSYKVYLSNRVIYIIKTLGLKYFNVMRDV